ncbi:MAG: phenylalanine--tRNA ligase subunit beta [Bryobacteraceae bacterium]|nr:phenylalanine--tRNA ligase subunit beta [Bryobacteraceae bacterium]
MKFSYNWIRELVRDLDVEPRELMRLITIKTAECEGVELTGAHFERVVAARVLSVEPIADSHNVKAVVDAGGLGRRTVVCGAPNCRAGIVTAYVPSGTALEGRVIEKRVVSGVESDGMLASAAELGINRDQEGILELDGVEPGARLPRLAADSIIEVDNKSLTHRPDLWGHHGMAREVAAITGKQLRDPVNTELVPAASPVYGVDIRDLQLCPRYSALVVANVKVGPSPLWFQQRLQAVGLNPINNIVDITNFVMAELAQPMHAFDADKLRGDTIIVRGAEEGERMLALNGEWYELTPSALVIADREGPIALAGVIGGWDSAISDTTTRIVFESANFHAASIRRTSSRLKLRTDASMRFEKAQDPVNTLRGLARAVALLELVAPDARIAGGLSDMAAPPRTTAPIELPMDWLVRKLGRPIAPGEVRRILEALEFGVSEPAQGVFSVRVPSWRATKDISIKDDLVEEIGRMEGYATIPPTPPLVPAVPASDNPRLRFFRSLRRMCAAQGFDEVYNYSFLSEEDVRRFGLAPEDHIRVTNPISVEQGLLRRTLIPGLWKNIQENGKHFASFRLFEVGFEIHKRAGSLPEEAPHLAAAMYSRQGGTETLFEVKRLAECLMPGCELRPAQARQYEHPSRAAEVWWRGEAAGRMFEFHPNYVETGRAVVLDIDLAVVERLAPADVKYKAVRRYPESAFDLSVVAGQRALVGDIGRQIHSLGGPYLEQVEFLRQYEGAPLPEGVKSVSFRITVAAADHTLSNEEVTAVRDGIISGMRASGYDLRV